MSLFDQTNYQEKQIEVINSIENQVKNIRIINNPPHFTEEDIQRAKKVFELVIPKHKKYQVYFYRLLLFSSNLTLIGTTEFFQ